MPRRKRLPSPPLLPLATFKPQAMRLHDLKTDLAGWVRALSHRSTILTLQDRRRCLSVRHSPKPEAAKEYDHRACQPSLS